MPASVNDAPAGDAERRLLAALAGRYAGAEFTARSAAAELDPALWRAAGVPRPDAGSCGRWLRARKGQAHGFGLAGRVDRNGANRWRLRGVEPRQGKRADLPPQDLAEVGEVRDIARDPAPSPSPSPETASPEPPPAPEAGPWWSVGAASPPAAGGAAERRRGAAWWSDLGGAAP